MKTYIINLPERTERLAQAKAELEKVGITNYEVYPAIKHEDGKLGIYLTLYKLIEQSYFDEEKAIAVFEDDVRFVVARTGKDIPKEIDLKLSIEILDRMPDAVDDYDIFYFGCNTHDPNEERTPLAKVFDNGISGVYIKNLLKVLDAYGCHAMIISRSGMFKILKAINKNADYDINDFDCPSKEIEDNRPIDVLIQQEIQPDGKCYCCNPIIATQRSGYSDIMKKEMNQDYIVDRFNKNVKNLFAILIAILFLVACNGIKRGHVVQKWTEPSHFVTTYIKAGGVLIPNTVFIKEKYMITIGDSIDNEYKTNDISVTKQDYDNTIIGEMASFK